MLILAALKSRDVAAVVSLMTATVALNSGAMIGFLSNHVDLSPNFCGTLMGITNSVACVGAILGPLSVGWFVQDRVRAHHLAYSHVPRHPKNKNFPNSIRSYARPTYLSIDYS